MFVVRRRRRQTESSTEQASPVLAVDQPDIEAVVNDDLRADLVARVRAAMFNSDALWATDVDQLAEIAVGVFVDAMQPPTTVECACGHPPHSQRCDYPITEDTTYGAPHMICFTDIVGTCSCDPR
jgi:hypothetical protein